MRLVCLLLALVVSTPLLAQHYPNRPVRMLIPFTVGSAADIIARAIEPQMRERLGQPLVIDNRGGAGGNIAAEMTAKAAPARPLVATLSKATLSALETKEAKDRLFASGVEVRPAGPDELAALIKSEIEKWAKVVKASGARAD
jgi:tripartite-type tricarboxylate transporter receptor subunit TctC